MEWIQGQVLGLEFCTDFEVPIVYIDYGNNRAPTFDLVTSAHADFINIYPHVY